MSDSDITDAVREIIAEELGYSLSAVCVDSRLEQDLGMDSLDGICLCLAIEDQFHLADISEEVAEKFQTVGDIVRYVRGKVESRK